MYEFHTPAPVRLRIEFGSGDIEIETSETDRTVVEVSARRDDESGREAIDETRVEQRGDDIVIEAPRRMAFFRKGPHLRLRVQVPAGSDLDAKIDSADLAVSGRLGDANVKTGSGDVRLDTVSGDISVQAGSGDVDIERAGNSSRVQSGSGDVRIRTSDGAVNAGTGSGDIAIDQVAGPVQLNSGSGDVKLDDAAGDVSVNTASGDQFIGRVVRGRMRSNSASGDVHIGIANGTAAWLSINSLSGSVHSDLDGAGPPEEDEDTVEIRVNTVSGDITLVRA